MKDKQIKKQIRVAIINAVPDRVTAEDARQPGIFS